MTAAITVSQVSTAVVSSATVTRPANTDAYTALDVVGPTAAAITFANVAPEGTTDIVIDSVELEYRAGSGVTGAFALALYTVTPPSALADNAAYDLAAGDRASFAGKKGIGTIADEGATGYARSDNLGWRVRLASTSLYGYLQTVAGFTPAGNSEVVKITLHTRPV